MTLFASAPIADVKVHDIAAAVDMTPAAVYYHYASKEQLLVRGLERFRDALVEEVRDAVADVSRPDDLDAFVERLLDWASGRPAAVVHFVSSAGFNHSVEALRRETRQLLLDELEPLARLRGDLDSATAGVLTVALLTQIEVSLASMLAADEVYRQLGPVRFRNETVVLLEQILGD